jgi:hypothetical protein
MFRPAVFFAVILFAAAGSFSQAPEKNPAVDKEEFRKQAVAFLRDAMADANQLRSLDNRISFAAEMAALMWFHDEKEARAMFAAVVSEFRELIVQHDTRMNMIGDDADEGAFYGGMFGDVSDHRRLARRFEIVMQVRQQIALSMAEHDGDLAFSFYADSAGLVTNAALKERFKGSDSNFEQELIARIAERNAAKASSLALRSLEGGVNFQHVELLQKIYTADPEKGAEFAAAILKAVKTNKSAEFYIAGSLLRVAGELFSKAEKDRKKPMLDKSQLRDLADHLGAELLSFKDDYFGDDYTKEIEKWAPSRGAQLRAAELRRQRAAARATGSNMNSNAYFRAEAASASSNVDIRAEQNAKREAELEEYYEKLGKAELPKQERDRLIAQARRVVLATPGRANKIVALNGLAALAARAGDRDVAAEIMREAEMLVNPQPTNYEEYMLSWMLASGYANADTAKAFDLLDALVVRANETVAAFMRVGEFIDTQGEFISDGEAQVGAFGGSMIRGLTGQLDMAESTLRTLAHADLKRTKAITERFDRTEVRVLAKMIVLRSILGGPASEKGKPAAATPLHTGR